LGYKGLSRVRKARDWRRIGQRDMIRVHRKKVARERKAVILIQRLFRK